MTPALIEDIRVKVAAGIYEFSRHAVNQTILRGISVEEVEMAFSSGEVIEDYPNDKYGPSCLVLGFTSVGCPLHIHAVTLRGL